MSKTFQKLTSLALLICIGIMLFSGGGYAAPTVKIVVSPNKTDVYAGSEPIVLTAQASGADLTYKWALNGPGKIDNTDLPAVFYMIPEKISGRAAQAVITVTVTDKTGQEVTESITLNILPGSNQRTQSESKKGMSKTTMIALGIVAAAGLGGGIALLTDGGDDNGSKISFTGTFRNEFTKLTDNGQTTMYVVNTFNLTQNDNSVTGTYEAVVTFGNCCTAAFAVPVTGTVDGTSGILSWPEARDTCSGINCSFTLYTNGGSYNTTLLDNGRLLQIDEYGNHARQSVVGCSETGSKVKNEIALPITGDFIRQ